MLKNLSISDVSVARASISLLIGYVIIQIFYYFFAAYFSSTQLKDSFQYRSTMFGAFLVISMIFYKVLSPRQKPEGMAGVIFELRRKSVVLNSFANALLCITVIAVGVGFFLIVFDESEETIAEETRTVLQSLRGFATNRVSNLEDTDKELKSIIKKIDLIVSKINAAEQDLELGNLKINLVSQQTSLAEKIALLRIELEKLEKLGGLRQLDAAFYEQLTVKVGVFIVLIFSVRFLGNRSAELRNLAAVYQRNADFLESLVALKIKPTRKEAFEMLTKGLVVPEPIGQIENKTIIEKIPSMDSLVSRGKR